MAISPSSSPPLDANPADTSPGQYVGVGPVFPNTESPAYNQAVRVAALQSKVSAGGPAYLSDLLKREQEALVEILGAARPSVQRLMAPVTASDTIVNAAGATARLPASSVYSTCGVAAYTSAELVEHIAKLSAAGSVTVTPPLANTGDVSTYSVSQSSNSANATLLDAAYAQAVRDAMSSGKVPAATILATMS